jgi:hypothetical protein
MFVPQKYIYSLRKKFFGENFSTSKNKNNFNGNLLSTRVLDFRPDLNTLLLLYYLH